AEIRAACAGPWLKIGVIEGIQHFRLQAELDPLADRNDLGDRQIIVEVVWPMQIDDLTDGSGDVVRRDVLRVGTSPRCQIFGIKECNLSRPGKVIDANGTLQLRWRHPMQNYAAIAIAIVVRVRVECVIPTL